MEPQLDKHSPLAQAIRFGAETIAAWLSEPARNKSEWRQNDFKMFRALCQEALTFLHPHDITSLSQAILYRVVLSIGEAEPQEEWWERAKVWEAEIRPNSLRCSTHINLATMTGASQTPLFEATHYNRDTLDLRAKLDEWKLELDAAISTANVFVSVFTREAE